jgi:hydrogenase expression/formation protein HypC
MCLGIPGEILSIEEDAEHLRKAKVRFGGATRDVYLDLVPDAEVGDYVIVHVGFAISRVDEAEAQETLAYFDQISEMGEDVPL